MVDSSIPVPSDPHLRRWMLFVDGENLAIRAAKCVGDKFTMAIGEYHQPNVFVWMPKVHAAKNWLGEHVPLQRHAIRAHYYTSVQGADDVLAAAREAIWKVGFSPSVFKKKEGKSKGVDIALTSDLLSHAFLDNYDAAVLIAGDGDYVRAIEEVKKRGKVAYVIFFRGDGAGLSPELRLAADAFFDLWPPFEYTWKQFLGAQTTAAAPMLTSARADIPR